MRVDEVDIRDARAEDASAIACVHEAAFGRPNEARLVEAISRSPAAVISIVAAINDGIIGHIFFSPVTIDDSGPSVAALGLAPLAVLPDVQRCGIGSKLVTSGLDAARRQGAQVVVVLGDPSYYQRFGFRPAREFGLRSEYVEAGDAFMARELTPGILTERSGLVRYLPEFAAV